MNVALVYDRVNKWGGAEQVLLALNRLYPTAPLYTAVYEPNQASWAEVFPKVIPSFLQQYPLAKSHHELYPWLTPLAFESFDFSGFDLVVSVTSAEAKAVITRPETKHICYCLTPTRYLWSHRKQYLNEPGLGWWFKPWQRHLQKNDYIYSQRPDEYVAISRTVQIRIKKYYQRESAVIYPPVETKKFEVRSPKHEVRERNYFLIVSRLVNYKKIDLAIIAFNRLKLPLVIVGVGRDQARLRRLAGPTVKFTGWVSQEKLISLYQNCRALVMPQEEDFGIVSIEAQASGKPVIAFGRGGATETVAAGISGILFNRPTVDSLIRTVKQFTHCRWQSERIKRQAEKFSYDNFINSWQQLTSKF